MRTFFVDRLINDHFHLVDHTYKHALKVLRVRVGDQFCVVYQKQRYWTQVVLIDHHKVVCSIIKQLPEVKNNVHVRVCFPICQQNKWDFVVEKLSELGVELIQPFWCQHCQRNQTINWERLKKIALNAAEQCNRSSLLDIAPVIEFDQLIKLLPQWGLTYFGDETLVNQTIVNCWKQATETTIVIGPPGGFSAQELESLRKFAQGAKLGNTILKSETAAIVLASHLILLSS